MASTTMVSMNRITMVVLSISIAIPAMAGLTSTPPNSVIPPWARRVRQSGDFFSGPGLDNYDTALLKAWAYSKRSLFILNSANLRLHWAEVLRSQYWTGAAGNSSKVRGRTYQDKN